jgi:hypothetical protein
MRGPTLLSVEALKRGSALQSVEALPSALALKLAPGRRSRTGARRSSSCRQASTAAAPYMSDDAEAAVGLALGTLSVAVSATCTLDRGIPSSWATSWHTLVCRPCGGRKGRHGEEPVVIKGPPHRLRVAWAGWQEAWLAGDRTRWVAGRPGDWLAGRQVPPFRSFSPNKCTPLPVRACTWPISTPPCVTRTVPSVYACTSAPA